MNTWQPFFILLFFFSLGFLEAKADSSKEVEALESALSVTTNLLEKAHLLKRLGQCYQQQGELEKAAKSYREVVLIAKTIHQKPLEEKALQYLGALYLDTAPLSTKSSFPVFTILLFLVLLLGLSYWARYRERSLRSMIFLKEQKLARDQETMARLNVKYRESQRLLKREKEGVEHRNQELIATIQELKKFAFMATHDLKEPLRTIGSYASLIKRRYKNQLDEDGQQFLGYITHGINRMHNLLSEVLHYAGLENSFREKEAEWIETNDVVVELEKGLQSQIAEKKAKLVWKNTLPSVKADRNHVFQIFQNLISNGLKYNQAAQPLIEIASSRQGDFYLFCIQDNGIGFDMNFKDRIFEVFQRLEGKEAYEGTGIGLAIVKKLIHFYGGEIWVESEINKGSRFYFTFPVHPQDTSAATPQKATTAQSSSF